MRKDKLPVPPDPSSGGRSRSKDLRDRRLVKERWKRWRENVGKFFGLLGYGTESITLEWLPETETTDDS